MLFQAVLINWMNKRARASNVKGQRQVQRFGTKRLPDYNLEVTYSLLRSLLFGYYV